MIVLSLSSSPLFLHLSISHLFVSLPMLSLLQTTTMADSFMGKAATMEIPINSNGETLAEDDSLEQVGHMVCVPWE